MWNDVERAENFNRNKWRRRESNTAQAQPFTAEQDR
jgi:hypothetical protein